MRNIFLDRLYDEASHLLRQAWAFGVAAESGDIVMPDEIRAAIIGESLRLVTRLTTVMAWTLARRAQQDEHAANHNVLAECPLTAQGAPGTEAERDNLPRSVRKLALCCDHLHDRAARLAAVKAPTPDGHLWRRPRMVNSDRRRRVLGL